MAYVRYYPNVEVRGQFEEASSLFPPCGFWGLSSGHQAWWQVPLYGIGMSVWVFCLNVHMWTKWRHESPYNHVGVGNWAQVLWEISKYSLLQIHLSTSLPQLSLDSWLYIFPFSAPKESILDTAGDGPGMQLVCSTLLVCHCVWPPGLNKQGTVVDT